MALVDAICCRRKGKGDAVEQPASSSVSSAKLSAKAMKFSRVRLLDRQVY